MSLAADALPRLAWLAPVGIILVRIAVDPRAAHCDVGQFLLAGRMILEGKVPFVDIIDTNPPLIMYLSAIPAALERVVPLHAATIFNLLTLGAVAASAWSLRVLLRRPETGLSGGEADYATLAWTCFSLGVHLNQSYGQRDHLFVLAFFPHAILRWVRFDCGKEAKELVKKIKKTA